jgi:transposase
VRRLGHSKDHRPDRRQVVIGLAVTRDGIPVRVWVWPGNTSDQTAIESVNGDLGGWKLGRCVWVVDSGFSSQENLRYLQRAGGHYIAGIKLRSGTAEAKVALKRQGRYHTAAGNMTVKEVVVGDGEARQRFVVARNPREADRDRTRREQTVTRLEAQLAKLEQTRGTAHENAACKLRAHRSIGRYLRQTKTGRLMIDRAKIRVIRVTEIRAGETWRTIGDQLQTIKLGRFRSPDGEFTQRTELTTDQHQLLKALGVPEPPRFGHITPASAKQP